MKRIISLFLIGLMLFSLAISLCGCKSEPAVSETTEKPDDRPTQEELEATEDEAERSRDCGDFKKSIELRRQLYSYGFYSDSDINYYERIYVLQCIQSKYLKEAVDDCKNKLRDPNSFSLYNIQLKKDTSNGFCFYINLDYGARNGFGGMVRKEFSYHVRLSSGEQEKVFEVAKESMRDAGLRVGIDCTGWYVASVPCLKQSHYEAILNGTSSYDKFY